MMNLPLSFQKALQPQPPSDYQKIKEFVASRGGAWTGLPHPSTINSQPSTCEPPAGKSRFKPLPRRRLRPLSNLKSQISNWLLVRFLVSLPQV